MNGTSKTLAICVVVVIAIALTYGFLTMPDRRSGAERVGDAIHELPRGPDKAIRELGDRTPGERVGDTVKDVGDKIKDGTNR
ncbi:MAG: hypothetical protein M3N08_02950 [Pseudomonadota bacterium]|nr:hypothetical protein [Pseudomonadota bacterium]